MGPHLGDPTPSGAISAPRFPPSLRDLPLLSAIVPRTPRSVSDRPWHLIQTDLLTHGRPRPRSTVHPAPPRPPSSPPSSSQPALSPPRRDWWNREDHAILRFEFDRIAHRIGHPFTLDACADPQGSNALVPNFCSPTRDFLHEPLAGQHVWLNPPFSRMDEFIDHYLAEKARSPQDTSACILVPAWRKATHPGLWGMRLVAQYEPGTPLFTAPCTDGSRTPLPGIPWGVNVFYDPPRPTVFSALQTEEGRLALRLPGRIAGASAQCLLDTGAQGTHYLSQHFCDQAGIAYTPLADVQVQVASGHTAPIVGEAVITVQIQSYRERLRCVVLPMAPDIDLILGDGWLRRRSAAIDYGAQSVILRDDLHDRFVTLRMAPPSAPRHSPPLIDGAPALGSSLDPSPPPPRS